MGNQQRKIGLKTINPCCFHYTIMATAALGLMALLITCTLAATQGTTWSYSSHDPAWGSSYDPSTTTAPQSTWSYSSHDPAWGSSYDPRTTTAPQSTWSFSSHDASFK